VRRALRPGGALLIEVLACNLELDGALAAGEAAALLRGAGYAGVRALADADVRRDYPSFRPPGLEYLREEVLLATA